MITVTGPWWAWLLYVFLLVPVIDLAKWCGDGLGHATYRWWAKRREGKDDL